MDEQHGGIAMVSSTSQDRHRPMNRDEFPEGVKEMLTDIEKDERL